MAELEHRLDVDAPFEDVLDLVGDFSILNDFHPMVATCDVEGEGVGATRTLTLSDGSEAVERLVALHADGYEYEHVAGQAPLTRYRGRVRVIPRGAGCTIIWSAEVHAERDEVKVVRRLLGLIETGAESAKRFLEG